MKRERVSAFLCIPKECEKVKYINDNLIRMFVLSTEPPFSAMTTMCVLLTLYYPCSRYKYGLATHFLWMYAFCLLETVLSLLQKFIYSRISVDEDAS